MRELIDVPDIYEVYEYKVIHCKIIELKNNEMTIIKASYIANEHAPISLMSFFVPENLIGTRFFWTKEEAISFISDKISSEIEDHLAEITKLSDRLKTVENSKGK